MANGTPLDTQSGPPYRLCLTQYQAPGDVLVMTAAVESLHKRYPGRYQTTVITTCDHIWKYNPWITPGLLPSQCHMIEMEYPAIHESGQRHVHFMAAYCERLSSEIGVHVPLMVNRPSIYLSEDEDKPLEATAGLGPYCVLNSGHKSDFTAKGAGTDIWQAVVDHFRGRLTFVQVGEQNPSHHHPPLRGVVNLVGRTTTRQLFSLTKHAVAAAGPVSFLLHIAAAFEVPYVALAGGRETPTWEQYSTTQYLHTLGQLECCRTKGCWRSRTVALHDGATFDKSVCSLPVVQPNGEVIPKCLQMIGSDGVIRSLEQLLGGL